MLERDNRYSLMYQLTAGQNVFIFPLSLIKLIVHNIIAIIINNRNFTSPSGYSERQGTDVDAASLTRLFMYLGFYTNRFDNLNGSDFRERLKVSTV